MRIRSQSISFFSSLLITVFAAVTALSVMFPSSARAEITEHLKTELIEAGVSPRAIAIMNKQLAQTRYKRSVIGIVDYTLPSTARRFFIIDLRTSRVHAYRVSHGVNTGGMMATAFSNKPGSFQSSLGLIRTGKERSGVFGRSLRLIGLSPSNSNLEKRAIILHSAEYASNGFRAKYGFFGRSFGCLTVSQKTVDTIIDRLGSGALILAYHDKLWDQAQKHPDEQDLGDVAQIPPPTNWEMRENRHGDPMPHKRGLAATSFYKRIYAAVAHSPCMIAAEPALPTGLSSALDILKRTPH
jgi:hypothetical protein